MFKSIFWISIVLLLCSCATRRNGDHIFDASRKKFDYEGRVEAYDGTAEALISSAASAVFSTRADSVTILLGAGGGVHAYVVIAVNDIYYGRFRVEGDSVNRIPVLLPEVGRKQVGVFKATEASTGPLLFYGVEAGNVVKSKTKSAAASIEFIGNSITSGFGADTKVIPCDTGTWYDQHNAYLAYGPLSARSLNADYRLSSVSGMGMYRNWNDEDTAPVMGDVYTTTHLDGDKSNTWNFPGKNPDLVSICLGTNDLSDGDGSKERKPFDAERFTANYVDFVKGVFERYPNTKLALLTSPMVSPEKNAQLLNCLQQVKAQFEDDHSVAIFEFAPMQPGGCGSHPDLADQRVMAKQLVPFYADLLLRK